MLKRDTRVQIVIVENGKYILLKHWVKLENRYFGLCLVEEEKRVKA